MLRSEQRRTWHIITGEYPPDVGGVGDYTASVARALAEAGDCVHVWTSGKEGTTTEGIEVHRVFGDFSRGDWHRGAAVFRSHARSGRLLVQWVPHAFGGRGVNTRFPLWLHGESVRRRDDIDVMVHEPFLPFAGSLEQRLAAGAQRVMTSTVLRAATRAFAGTPAWIDMCRPFAGAVAFRWTPIPSGVPCSASEADRNIYRRRLALEPGERLIGCFGRAGTFQEDVLTALATSLRSTRQPARLLVIGIGSDAAAAQIAARSAVPQRTVLSTGVVEHSVLSAALRACDVMIQPYVAGICARHSSAAALLAHGCAVVTNRGPFTEPLWIDAQAVSIAPSSEPEAIAAATLQLLGERAEQERLSRAALDLYRARFDVRHTIAALRE